jgi:hypothetical protein
MKLWHCSGARSLRPLEEMGLEYELEILPFPPRHLPVSLPRAYLERLQERPAFARADGYGEPLILPAG